MFPAAHRSTAAAVTEAKRAPAVDPLAAVKEKAAQELFVADRDAPERLDAHRGAAPSLARAELAEIVAGEQLALSTSERNRLIDDIGADVLGSARSSRCSTIRL